MKMRNNIKILRKRSALRQEDLAEKLAVTRQTIIAIENNRYDPSLSLAFKLANLLGTTVDELFSPNTDE
jgi:Predicted transcriptional regulators